MQKLAIDGGQPVRRDPFPKWPIFGELEQNLLLEVLNSGLWGGTGRVKLPIVEERFAKLHGAKHAVTVVNGTVAITVALKAAGVEPGDEVIVPPYTFYATAAAPLMYGAIPVFADVDPKTLMLDPASVEERITPRTKAIIPVHLGGAMADMDALTAIAKRHGLVVIEDAAQAVGAMWNHKGAGSIGDLGTFSFQSSKNVNAGEGGIILTNSDEMADMAWSLTNAGRVRGGEWYQHEHLGWNLRMTEFQAAVVLGQMERLEDQMTLRSKNAELLNSLMRDIEGIVLPEDDPRMTRHAYHLYIFKLSPELAAKVDKKTFCRMLNAEGIPVQEGYHSLNLNHVLQKEIYKCTGKQDVQSCPNAERAAAHEAMWLAQNVLLGDESDVHDIATAVRKVVQAI